MDTSRYFTYKRSSNKELLGSILDSIKTSQNDYNLIMKSNEILIYINEDIVFIYKVLKDVYSRKFPELESINMSPIDYAKTVLLIRNEMDLKKIDLHCILPPSLVLIISMSSTTTSGRPLKEDELHVVCEASKEIVELENAKQRILSFIESQMMIIAPNLSCIVGTSIAAKLVGQAGSISLLSKIPAGNIHVLGSQKKNMAGFSKAQINPHVGYIGECDLILTIPFEYRTRAQRIISGKCALAARVDADASKNGQYANGEYGQKMRKEIEKKIEKLMEPPPIGKIKALPAPKEYAKERRAGKRVRKQKELIAETELRRMQNRVVFGGEEQEAVFGDTIKGLGLLGSGSGKLRPSINKKLTDTLKNKVKQSLPDFSHSKISGTTTSLAFTPYQGLEIQNPETLKKDAPIMTSRYFANTGFKKNK